MPVVHVCFSLLSQSEKRQLAKGISEALAEHTGCSCDEVMTKFTTVPTDNVYIGGNPLRANMRISPLLEISISSVLPERDAPKADMVEKVFNNLSQDISATVTKMFKMNPPQLLLRLSELTAANHRLIQPLRQSEESAAATIAVVRKPRVPAPQTRGPAPVPRAEHRPANTGSHALHQPDPHRVYIVTDRSIVPSK